MPAKRKLAAPITAVVPAAAEDAPVPPTAQPILGLVLDINGKPVTLNSGAIGDYKKNGFEFGLTDPVDLGSFETIKGQIAKQFNITIPDAKDLPEPLQTIYTKVMNLDITILKAHIKLPGSASADQNKYYTLVMSVLESSGDLVSLGPIGLRGAVIGVTNETSAPS